MVSQSSNPFQINSFIRSIVRWSHSLSIRPYIGLPSIFKIIQRYTNIKLQFRSLQKDGFRMVYTLVQNFALSLEKNMKKLLLTMLIICTSLCQLRTYSMQSPKIVTSSSNLLGIVSNNGGVFPKRSSSYIQYPSSFFSTFDQKLPRLMGDFMRSLPYSFYYLISISVSYFTVDPRKSTGRYNFAYLTDKGLLKISLIYEQFQGNDGYLHFTGSSLVDGENQIGANLRQNYV